MARGSNSDLQVLQGILQVLNQILAQLTGFMDDFSNAKDLSLDAANEIGREVKSLKHDMRHD